MLSQNGRGPFRAASCAKRGKLSCAYRYWWVAVFICVSCLVYTHASQKKNVLIADLDTHLATLSKEKDLLLQNKEDLLLQINSQSDPAWIQLTLMKGLGLVPEGQLKIYFQTENDLK